MNEDFSVPNSGAQDQPNGRVKHSADIILSYFICPQDAAGGYLGALMLTDSRARPLHFSFVSPIRPTKIQRILYGPTLEEHLKVDVISKKLLKDLPYGPDVLLVDTEELVTVRRVAQVPTAFLTKPDEDEVEPGRLTALRYDTDGNIEDQEAVGQILASLETMIDLVEPFDRMREALKEAIKTGEAGGGE